MNNIDWDLIHSFLLVARSGSLSAAARKMGVSQPTLTRDIQALESTTQLNLFRRTTQGLQLTASGQALVESAYQMESAADRFSRQVSGVSQEPEGDVRISVNEIVGIFLLPEAITALRRRHPGLHIEIVISNLASNLNKREADIALRMFRPTQPNLKARRLPDMELGFYAHHEYLDQYGRPNSLEEFMQHSIIGFDENCDFIEGAAQLGFKMTRDNFTIRTDHLLMQVNLCRAGAGIAGLHVELAKQWHELTRILEWVPLPALEFWIVCHSDVQYNTRIRTVVQFLTDWFAVDPYKHLTK